MLYETIKVGENDSFVLPEPESYGDCLLLIESDRYWLTGRRINRARLLLFLVTHPFNLLAWYRLAHYRGVLNPLCRLMYKLCRNMHKIDMPPRLRAGWGLYLGHRMCMVVNGGTILGNNVNLSQFVNIGTNHNTPAIIGSNVYIGPMACVVEDVHIGSGSTIGAGAVVVKDVAPGSICVGVPARTLKSGCEPMYIGNRWPYTGKGE